MLSPTAILRRHVKRFPEAQRYLVVIMRVATGFCLDYPAVDFVDRFQERNSDIGSVLRIELNIPLFLGS